MLICIQCESEYISNGLQNVHNGQLQISMQRSPHAPGPFNQWQHKKPNADKILFHEKAYRHNCKITSHNCL